MGSVSVSLSDLRSREIKAVLKDQVTRLMDAAEEEQEWLRTGVFDAKLLDTMLLVFKNQIFDASKRLQF